jgi:hypothetical protein
MNLFVHCKSLGSQRVTFQAPLKIDIINTALLLLKLCNKCYEGKNRIFMNVNQLNVIHNNQITFNEIKKIKFCTFTICLKPRPKDFLIPTVMPLH